MARLISFLTTTGWSLAWRINLWARALDSERAHKCLSTALRHSIQYETWESSSGVYYNLFDSHTPFQIDGNFGTTAGIAKMLLQSYTGTLQLLPALPSSWKSGKMNGLCCVGGFDIDQTWNDGVLTSVTIHSKLGNDCTLQYKDIANFVITDSNGAKVETESINSNCIKFATTSGVSYHIDDPAGSIAVEINHNDAAPIYYNIQGMKIDHPSRGNIYIVKRGEKVSKEIF